MRPWKKWSWDVQFSKYQLLYQSMIQISQHVLQGYINTPASIFIQIEETDCSSKNNISLIPTFPLIRRSDVRRRTTSVPSRYNKSSDNDVTSCKHQGSEFFYRCFFFFLAEHNIPLKVTDLCISLSFCYTSQLKITKGCAMRAPTKETEKLFCFF